MEHRLVSAGGRRCLIVEPQITGDGKPVGYGNLLRQIGQAIKVAGSLGTALYLVPPSRPLNTAVFDLDSPDLTLIGQSSREAGRLRRRWRLGEPFRYGRPWLWLRSNAARRLRPRAHALMTLARGAGWRRTWRALDRLDARCRRAATEYGRVSEAAWRELTGRARARVKAGEASEREPSLRLRPEAEAEADRLARAAGLDPSLPMVTLHVRESGYRQRGAGRQQYTDTLRDARIETYRDAAAWLVSRGTQVVRLGDPSMTPLSTLSPPLPGVVDLATAPWRTDAFELWAMLRSRFFIASDSGPYFLAVLCGVPSLTVNVVQVGYYTVRPRDRYVCKLARDRASRRRLTLEAMIAPAFMATALDPERWSWDDNSAEDLREAVDDMHRLIEGGTSQRDGGTAQRTPSQARHDLLLDGLSAVWQPNRSQTTALLFRRRGRGTISPGFSARYLDFDDPPLP